MTLVDFFLNNQNKYYDVSVYHHLDEYKNKLFKNIKIDEIDENFFNDFRLYIIKKYDFYFYENINTTIYLINNALNFFF